MGLSLAYRIFSRLLNLTLLIPLPFHIGVFNRTFKVALKYNNVHREAQPYTKTHQIDISRE